MKQRQIVRTVILCAAVLLAACALKWGWGAPSLVPFDAAAIEQIELYRYDVPAAAEKKTVSDPAQVAWVCDRLSVWAFPWPFANTGAGGGAASFRFHLADGTTYELICTPPYTVHRADGSTRCTLTELEQIWYDCAAAAAPAPQDELPVLRG